jgi:hypothetical protein
VIGFRGSITRSFKHKDSGHCKTVAQELKRVDLELDYGNRRRYRPALLGGEIKDEKVFGYGEDGESHAWHMLPLLIRTNKMR